MSQIDYSVSDTQDRYMGPWWREWSLCAWWSILLTVKSQIKSYMMLNSVDSAFIELRQHFESSRISSLQNKDLETKLKMKCSPTLSEHNQTHPACFTQLRRLLWTTWEESHPFADLSRENEHFQLMLQRERGFEGFRNECVDWWTAVPSFQDVP